jgi:hypothetical protein
VVNVASSVTTGDSRKPRVAALGFRYFGGRAVYVVPTLMAQIFTGER